MIFFPGRVKLLRRHMTRLISCLALFSSLGITMASSPPTMLSFMSMLDVMGEQESMAIFPLSLEAEDQTGLRVARRRQYHAMNHSTMPSSSSSSDELDFKSIIYLASGLVAEGLTSLINHGYRWATDANWKDVEALFHACHLNNVTEVQALLARGVCPNSWSPSEETPLMMAARDGFIDVIKALLSAGADPLLRTRNGNDALIYAAKGGSLPAFKELCAQPGIEPDRSDRDRRTPLLLAAYIGREAILKDLLTMPSVDINHQDISGSTALHLAAFEGRMTITKMLLTAGALHSFRDNVGETPLHRSAFRHHFHATKLLLLAGADPLARSNNGSIPFDNLRHRYFPDLAEHTILRIFTNMRLVMLPGTTFEQSLVKDLQLLIMSRCIEIAQSINVT